MVLVDQIDKTPGFFLMHRDSPRCSSHKKKQGVALLPTVLDGFGITAFFRPLITAGSDFYSTLLAIDGNRLRSYKSITTMGLPCEIQSYQMAQKCSRWSSSWYSKMITVKSWGTIKSNLCFYLPSHSSNNSYPAQAPKCDRGTASQVSWLPSSTVDTGDLRTYRKAIHTQTSTTEQGKWTTSIWNTTKQNKVWPVLSL